MQTRDGNPWQARALKAEMDLATERELRRQAEKSRASYQTQTKRLQSAERKESRAARAILQKHESQVSSIEGMAHPSSRYSDESKILEQFMLRWQKEDWTELMLRVLARQATEDGEDLTFWIESCASPSARRCRRSSTSATWRRTTSSPCTPTGPRRPSSSPYNTCISFAFGRTGALGHQLLSLSKLDLPKSRGSPH